jgi:hypothetical protein
VQSIVPDAPVTSLVVFMDRARFPKGLPEGVTTLTLLRQVLPLTNAECIGAEHRAAWETVTAQVLTDRLSRDAHLLIAKRRKRER